MKKTYKILLSLAVICIFIAIIFSFSEQPGNESHSLSKEVSYKIVHVALSHSDSANYRNISDEYIAGLFDYPIRKLAHVCVYMTLGLVVTSALWFIFDYDLHFLHIFLAVLFVFIIGCADETVQSFSGGRGSTITDAFIDAFGGMLGVYAHFIIRDIFVHLSHGIKKIGKKKNL